VAKNGNGRTARAMWKGTVVIGKVKLPVKLYSAATDHTIHFRLLHKTDHAPVKQMMIDSESGEPVDYKDTKKALPVTRNRLVVLDREELEKIAPEESRDIEITRFVDPADIDHRWYDRPYYLGPDGDIGNYFAAAEALRKKKKEGVAHWVMRKKEYIGALREANGYLMLIALRHADEVIDADVLRPPAGRPLQKREVDMARQLLSALEGDFVPTQFKDHYRARVMELIEAKAKGRKPKIQKFRPRKTDEDRIAAALERSLEKVSA
jgi:DNA end-binding protein Ku